MDVKRLAVGALLLFVATRAHAAIVFDNPTNIAAGPEGTRSGSLTFGALLSGNPSVTINQIQLSLDPNKDFTFYILQRELGGAAGSVTWLTDGDATDPFGLLSAIEQGLPTGGGFLSTNPFASGSQIGCDHDFAPLCSAGSPTGGWAGLPTGSLDGGKGAGNFVAVPIGTGPTTSDVNQENGLGADGENMFQPQISAVTSDSGHLPEPSTLTIFGLGTFAVALGVLRRRCGQGSSKLWKCGAES